MVLQSPRIAVIVSLLLISKATPEYQRNTHSLPRLVKTPKCVRPICRLVRVACSRWSANGATDPVLLQVTDMPHKPEPSTIFFPSKSATAYAVAPLAHQRGQATLPNLQIDQT